MAYFKDVPAGSKFILKTKVKTMEKEQEGTMPDPASDVYFTFDYTCKGSWPEEVRKAAEQNVRDRLGRANPRHSHSCVRYGRGNMQS